MHPKVIFSRIIGKTLERILGLGSARLVQLSRGFLSPLFFMQVVSVSQKKQLMIIDFI